jgi:hypothetical protein
VVQTLPSSQELLLFVWTQPEDGLQLSFVHALLSSQLIGVCVHPDAPQASAVQALPSSQFVPVWTQPVTGLQVSTVHGFESAQSSGGPPWHEPPLHASFVVQTLPSLQGAVLLL